MKHIFISLLMALVFLLSACAPAASATQTVATSASQPTPVDTPIVPTPTISVPTPTEVQVYTSMNIVKVPAPSLENNLVNEPAERMLYVYLPPSYNTSDNRYPVLYYLPGYGDGNIIGFRLPDDMDKLIADGQVNEMIIVVASGTSKLGGSFYVNSPVTGNWEDFIVKDVVGYVDGHFRTLAQVESRGITGHSMGGFGALNIAMHHPEVFSAVYSMSPGLFDENGLAESQMFNSESLIQKFVEYEKEVSASPLEDAQRQMFASPQQFALSYGFAFAPNPDRHPPYFDYPYTEVNGQLVRDDVIWKKWESGFGGIADEAKQYKDNFLQLKGIVVDYGTNDEYAWIPKGCAYFTEQLIAASIPVKVESYDGTHQSGLSERIRGFMLPFFSTTLKFESGE
jgi:S-formylglutathione hydrolase FrmB